MASDRWQELVWGGRAALLILHTQINLSWLEQSLDLSSAPCLVHCSSHSLGLVLLLGLLVLFVSTHPVQGAGVVVVVPRVVCLRGVQQALTTHPGLQCELLNPPRVAQCWC